MVVWYSLSFDFHIRQSPVVPFRLDKPWLWGEATTTPFLHEISCWNSAGLLHYIFWQRIVDWVTFYWSCALLFTRNILHTMKMMYQGTPKLRQSNCIEDQLLLSYQTEEFYRRCYGLVHAFWATQNLLEITAMFWLSALNKNQACSTDEALVNVFLSQKEGLFLQWLC